MLFLALVRSSIILTLATSQPIRIVAASSVSQQNNYRNKFPKGRSYSPSFLNMARAQGEGGVVATQVHDEIDGESRRLSHGTRGSTDIKKKSGIVSRSRFRCSKKGLYCSLLAICIGGAANIILNCKKSSYPVFLAGEISFFTPLEKESSLAASLLRKSSQDICWKDVSRARWKCRKYYKSAQTFHYTWRSKPESKLCLDKNGSGISSGLLYGSNWSQNGRYNQIDLNSMVRRLGHDCMPDADLVESVEPGWRLVSAQIGSKNITVSGNDTQFEIRRALMSLHESVELVFEGFKFRDQCVEIADPLEAGCARLKKICDNPHAGMEKKMDNHWCLQEIDHEPYTPERLYKAIMKQTGATFVFVGRDPVLHTWSDNTYPGSTEDDDGSIDVGGARDDAIIHDIFADGAAHGDFGSITNNGGGLIEPESRPTPEITIKGLSR